MEQWFDHIIFYEELSPSDREALHAALREDEGLADLFDRWHALQDTLRDRLMDQIPDRHQLVQYALASGGHASVLTAAEEANLEVVRPNIEAALEEVPALQLVLQQIESESADFETAWEAHAAPSPPFRRVAHGSTSRGFLLNPWMWRAAAVLALAAFSTVLYLFLRPEAGLQIVRTGVAEIRSIELDDGTRVRVMAESRLVYRPVSSESAPQRTVTLTGSALFDVVPQQGTFVVETPTALTTVKGTRFGIQADEAITSVVLESGRVVLAARSEPEQLVDLAPGQMSRVTGSSGPTAPSDVDLAEALGWTGSFFFRESLVQSVAARLSTFYDAPVEVAPRLIDQQVTGTFEQSQSVSEILDVLAVTLGARVVRTADGGYRLEPSP